MFYYFIFVLFFLNVKPDVGNTQTECFSSKNYFSHYLGTKTPYRFVLNKNDSVIRYEGCQSKKMWMLIRHGTRNPGEKMIAQMRTRLPSLRARILNNHNQSKGELCDSELAELALWAPQVDLADQKRLVHEGEDEMVELAERIQNRFPDLLPEEYSNASFKFRFTATQRTKESQRHFTIGLFGRRVARYVWSPEPLHRDPVLRFYKLCARWKKEVDKNPDSLLERKYFEETELMKTLLHDISKRLGFDNDLHLDDVQLMYMTCAFETAWSHRTVSPWCPVFTEDALKVFEFAQDLEYFWIDGYGHTINFEQACPLVSDMLQHITSEDDPRSVFYFTHSGTLLKTLAHLGLYNDKTPLRHNAFNETRLWMISRIDAFATNLAFVLFKCADGLKVLALHQERPVFLPNCPEDNHLCPLDTLLETYHDSLYDCRFSEMCQLDSI